MGSKKIAVIGAGLGGLAVSALLASGGNNVTVFEKNSTAGGKMNQLEVEGYRFDTGPSLLTMPFILEELFARCGTDLHSYVSMEPLNPLCRYFYSDGTTFDSFHDIEQTKSEVSRIAPADSGTYSDFLTYSSQLYKRTKDAFLFNPLFDLRDLASLDPLDFFRIDAFSTVSRRVNRYFESPYMRKFFKRFATYNGSSPFQAPATLNVIPHVELNLGGYYPKGGMYQIVEALATLNRELGVALNFDAEVTAIETTGGAAESIRLKDGDRQSFDLIISNSDASETYLNLLDNQQLPNRKRRSVCALEPSCSGFVLLLGVQKRFDQLKHHNIFFSENYEREFSQIFQEQVMPLDPTIYIADTSSSNPEHAPTGASNLFVLINAPYLSEKWNWEKKESEYSDFVIHELERRGLKGLSSSIEVKESITPRDFYRQYRSNKGSIYGTSSNSRLSAFMRPSNKSRHVENLYLVGGSTHPGGGIPLVILSAFHAHELIHRYEYGI